MNRVFNLVFLAAACLIAAGTFAQDKAPGAAPPAVHLVWMGGDDCPPCVVWRQNELPKLRESGEFKRIRFSYVTKSIRSPVPPGFLLDAEVKPYKELLDEASSGRGGSPQGAVIVDGKIFDYFHSVRSAAEIDRMLLSIRTATPYPFQRCVKMSKQWKKCEIPG